MAEVQGGDVKAILPSVSSHESGVQGPVMMPDPPLVVRQHMESPRKYIILTQQVCDGVPICQCFGNISEVIATWPVVPLPADVTLQSLVP
jgi:hypothetical protein